MSEKAEKFWNSVYGTQSAPQPVQNNRYMGSERAEKFWGIVDQTPLKTAMSVNTKRLAETVGRQSASYDSFDNRMLRKYQGKGFTSLAASLNELGDGEEKNWLKGYAGYVDREEKRNLDLDAYSREIQALERQLEDYDPEIDWTNPTERKQYDKGLQELEDEINRRKQYLTQAQRIQKQDSDSKRFADIRNREDFEKNSTVDGSNQEVGYRYVNADAAERLELEQQHGDRVKQFGDHAWDSLNEEEKQVYNYLMNTGDREGAAEYLRYLEEDLQLRKGTEADATIDALVQEDPKAKALRYAFMASAGYDQHLSGMKGAGKLLAGEDGYVPTSSTQVASGLIREDLAEDGRKLPEWMGGGSTGQMVGDLISTTANMAPSMAVGLISPKLGAAMMGVSAAGGAYQEKANEGYSKEQARKYGIAVGASETALGMALSGIKALGGSVTNHVIENALKGVKSGIGRFIIEYGGSIASEALEEGIQEILTPIFSNRILGTEEKVDWGQVVYSALLGGLSAGILEGPSAVASAREGAAEAKNATAEKSSAAGDKLSATAPKTEAVQMTGDIDSFAQQFGKQAEAVKQNYLEGQDLQEYEVGFQAAFAVGRESGKKDGLQKVPYLSQSQKEIAFNLGREAAAREVKTDAPKQTGITAKRVTDQGTQDVTIAEVTGMDNDTMTFRLADGSTVTDEELSFDKGNEVLSAVWELGMNTEQANSVVADMASNEAPDIDQAAGLQEAYHYGENGYTMEQLAQRGKDAAVLTDGQRKAAWEAGRKVWMQKAETPTNKIKPAGKSGVWFDNGSGDVIAYDDFDDSGLRDTARAGVQAAQVLQKLGIGKNYYFYESYVNKAGERVYKDENGVEKKAPNGWYDPADGSIHIDLNAGRDANGVTLYTLSHELVHMVEDQNKKAYRRLADFLVENYAKGEDVDALVFKKQAELSRGRGEAVSYEEAYSEFIADSMEAMLADGNVPEKLQELKKNDRDLFDRIKAFFDKVLKDIRKFYQNLKPDSDEGKMVLQMKDQIEQIQQLFAEALAGTGEMQAAEEIGLEVDAETESVAPAVMYSERTWRESDYVQERRKAAREISEAIGVSVRKAEAYIDSVNSIAKMIAEDRTRLDYFSSPNRSSFVGNVEYGGSFDFSTLCKKRRLLTGTFTAIQKALPNTALTANEILDIRNRMKDAGLEVSCGLCYVEGSRANMGQFAKEFLKLYKQYYPDAWQPNMADVNTPDGIEWVRINHPECYEQYEYFWNHYGTLKPGDRNLFASQQKPKLYQLHTEYKGEILQKFKGDDNVEEKNLNCGIRLQSFSDFEIVHLIDTMQIIMDMSRVGLAGQAYTKVPDFAWALGDTGLKINLSLIAKGVDADGKLIFDDIEGMPIAEAMRLRDRYSKNVGTILVAFNDAQLMAAMADDRVDFIIPFHRSQWKKSQYEAMGLPAKTKDYTYMQNEKFIKPQYHEYRGRMVKDKATNYMPNEYWDFSKSGKDNAIAYLEMCARNNKRPKFYKLLQNNGDGSYSLKADGSTDGYWKLLIDFKMYDNDGNGSPQMPVKPEFNMEEATRMLNDYAGGHSNFPVAQGIVDEFVKEYKESHGDRMYQDRSTGTSNRDLLAGAFEQLAQKSDEKEFLEKYRKNIKGLNEQEAKLQELRRQIREISFSKGPRDTKKLKELQEEATKTANRINNYDKILLNLEATVPLKRVLERERQKVKQKADADKKAAVARVREETKAAIEGVKSASEIMEREFLRLMREYEKLSSDSAEKAKKAKKTIDQKQDTIDSYKADLATMEREFLRVMKGYETAERKTNAFWEGEFKRLMREYEASGRKVDRLEAKLKAQRESIRSNVDSRRRTVLRNKIRKDIRELDKILNKGNKKRNVKQGMQDFVAKAIATGEILFADLDSDTDLIASGIQADMNETERKLLTEAERYVRQIAELEGNEDMSDVLAARQKGLDEVLKQLQPVLQRERIRINSADASSAFDALVASYESLQESPDAYIAAAFNPDALEYLKSVKHKFAGTLVKDMSQEQLQTLHKCYKMVMTMIRDANKAFVDGRSVQADAEQMVQEFQKRKIPEKKVGIILRNLSNAVGWNYEKLYYALERINSPTLKRLYQNLADSENITMQDAQEAKAFQMEMVEKYHYNDWKTDQKMERTFLDNNGKEFQLTLGELMALYAYSRREDADRHIEVGGFTFGKNALTDPEPASTYKLTADQVAAISNLLTPEQKSFAEEMQRYLSKTMGAKGNEVSLKLYGIEMFGEENYFPLHIAGEYKARAQESQAKAEAGFQSMTNAGFTKARNSNATAPIVLEGFMEVWVDHVNEMARYHGAVPALEDIRRVMNYSVYSDSMADSVSVKAAMTNAYGKQAVQYFDSLYREANSGAVTDKMDAVSKTLLSAFRKNSVAYSGSVVIQQPASIYRAMAIVDPKYFGQHGLFTLTGGVLRAFNRAKWNAAYADMMKYAPGVTMAKEIGGFDTSTGGSIRSYLLDTDRGFRQSMKNGTAAQKAGALLNVVDDNVIANLPNVADKIAWIEIWEACRRETVANNPKLATGSEAFKQKVGQRFTEVIRATQVYDSMFSKSPMLKSKNLAVQYVVSFMNEPNTVANMAEKALRDVLQGNVKTAGKAIGALATSIVVTNLLKSIVYAMRDDDEDETFREKYLSAVAGNLVSDVNLLNYIPYARDIWSLKEGYDVERADMAVVADAVNAITKLQKLNKEDVTQMTEEELEEWDKKVMDAQWKVAESLSPLAGIPLKNIRREVLAAINAVKIRELDKTRESTELSIRHAIEEATGQAERSDREKLYEAILAGDKVYTERLKAGYKDEDAYHAAIRKGLREKESRIWEAAVAWNNNDLQGYMALAREIIAEGKFVQDDVVLAIRAEASAMEERKESSSSKVKGYFSNEKLGVAMGQNNTAMADTIRQDLIDTAVANGKTHDEAARSVESTARSQLKELFETGSISASVAEKMLVKYGGYDREDASGKVAEWKYETDHPELDGRITFSQYKRWEADGKSRGISLEVYTNVVEYRGGNTSSGTRSQDDVAAYINAMPISKAQKDALWCCFWSEKTLYKNAPWH